MSSIDDFREWLNSKDPKLVRSLVLDAYSSDRKFLRAFEKVVDSDLSSATGNSWAQLFSAATDWDYQKNATYLLESNYWDSRSKLTLIGILNIIAYFLNINWKSELVQSNNPRPDGQESTTSSTQKAYLEQRKQLQQLEHKNQNDEANQRVDDYIHNQTRSQQRVKEKSPPINNEVRDRRGQLVSTSPLNNSSSAQNPTWQILGPLAILILIGGFAGLVQLESQNSNIEDSQTQASSHKRNEKSYDPVSFYELEKASRLQRQAVLICEHKSALKTLEDIKSRTNNWNIR